MKISQLDPTAIKYVDVKVLEELKPFTKENSLFVQILPFLKELLVDNLHQPMLFFSATEEKMIIDLVNQIVGGIHIDRGLGHTTSGIMLLLNPVLEKECCEACWMPTDGDISIPMAEIKNWSLTIKPR